MHWPPCTNCCVTCRVWLVLESCLHGAAPIGLLSAVCRSLNSQLQIKITAVRISILLTAAPCAFQEVTAAALRLCPHMLSEQARKRLLSSCEGAAVLTVYLDLVALTALYVSIYDATTMMLVLYFHPSSCSKCSVQD